MSLSNPSIGMDFAYPEDYSFSRDKPFTLLPDILTHPNIPKPLHEVNPRNIMGKEKWDKLRPKVYASTNYHCIACGVHKSEAKGHQWLEAHEYYNIDYGMGRVEIDKIVPLCHYCHNFIHSGRLSMIIGEEKTEKEVIEILEHGFRILAENDLHAFYFTVHFAHQIGANTFDVQPAATPDGDTPVWEDWRLVYEGVEYPPIYKTYEHWKRRYAK